MVSLESHVLMQLESGEHVLMIMIIIRDSQTGIRENPCSHHRDSHRSG